MLLTRDETANVRVELNVYKGRGMRFRENKNHWCGYVYVSILGQSIDTEKIDLGEHSNSDRALDYLSDSI